MPDHLLIASVLVGLNATKNGKSGTMVLLPEMSRKLSRYFDHRDSGTISRLPNEKCRIYRYFFGVERCGTMRDHGHGTNGNHPSIEDGPGVPPCPGLTPRPSSED